MKVIKTSKNDFKEIEVEKGYFIQNFLCEDKKLGYSLVGSKMRSGKHPKMKNIGSHRTYYFCSGSAIFHFDDGDIECKQGDTITIPKDTFFSFEGEFEAIIICCPSFDPKDDVIFR